MLESLKDEANFTRTENGALTRASSGSRCLDLFATVGALRAASTMEIELRFLRAWAEDPELAMKLLFFARDVRGGLGERRVFRVALRWLAQRRAESVRKNLRFVPEYGRWDDLLCLLDSPCEAEAFDLIRAQLDADRSALGAGGEVSLLGKWLPSVNAHSAQAVRDARRIASALGLREREYRRLLSKLRARIHILENNLRLGDYSFDYGKQPAGALLKYRRAFLRNDFERYVDFLARVSRGETTMHTGTLAPYDIVAPLVRRLLFDAKALDEAERRALDVTWRAQEDFTGGENALVVADGSGSMYGDRGNAPCPAAVAQSLAIYFAERNAGAFHNHFITFSEHPQLVEIRGADIAEKMEYCMSYNEVANTDLRAVFELILRAAVRDHLPQSELPARLYVISDMEFDACVKGGDVTNFECAREMFAERGYALPEVVFWNVDSRNRQQPVSMNEQGVTLVSGASPRVFEMLRGNTLSPYAFMLQTLNSARYAPISA